MTTPPTIADVWDAFVALSAAWIKAEVSYDGLHLQIWPNGFGYVSLTDGRKVTDAWDTFADALTAIAEARAGLEG